MKTRRVLKKWVKVVLTIILVIVGVLVYNNALDMGALGQESNLHFNICVIEWLYLFIVQFLLLDLVWSN